jgi:hypothetical protein
MYLLTYSERIPSILLTICTSVYLAIFILYSGKRGYNWSRLFSRLPKRIREWIKKEKLSDTK